MKPTQFSSSGAQGSIFGFNRGARDSELFLCTPCEWTVPQIDQEPIGGKTIIRVTSLVRTREGREIKRTKLKKNPKFRSAIEIS